MLYSNNDLQEYADYLESHAEEIKKAVNDRFDQTRPFLKAKLKKIIRGYLDPLPVHYDWEPSDCPCDFSGMLIENGRVDLMQTVSEFLENEYTGTWTATYISGCGKRFETYGDFLSFEIHSITGMIANSVIADHLRDRFAVDILSDHDIEQIVIDFGDSIFEGCIASELFWYENAIEYYQLDAMTLKELLL